MAMEEDCRLPANLYRLKTDIGYISTVGPKSWIHFIERNLKSCEYLYELSKLALKSNYGNYVLGVCSICHRKNTGQHISNLQSHSIYGSKIWQMPLKESLTPTSSIFDVLSGCLLLVSWTYLRVTDFVWGTKESTSGNTAVVGASWLDLLRTSFDIWESTHKSDLAR
jgi:hypothetical protein